MNQERQKLEERANRIAFLIGIQQESLVNLFEQLVDKDYEDAKAEIKVLMTELRLIFKSIEYDDF
jgi:ketol-acid reductoisomerase